MNCIIAFNTRGIGVDTNSTATLWNTCVFGNAAGDFVNLGGAIVTNGIVKADPMFISPSLGDYRLHVTSPCIDVGDDSVVPGGCTDVRGKPRIMGDHVDMGAYEFHPSGFSFSDMLYVARVAGGLESATADAAARLDLVTVGTSAGRLDGLDLVRLLRRSIGFDD